MARLTGMVIYWSIHIVNRINQDAMSGIRCH
jgi:hypothetical protein